MPTSWILRRVSPSSFSLSSSSCCLSTSKSRMFSCSFWLSVVYCTLSSYSSSLSCREGKEERERGRKTGGMLAIINYIYVGRAIMSTFLVPVSSCSIFLEVCNMRDQHMTSQHISHDLHHRSCDPPTHPLVLLELLLQGLVLAQ